MEKQPVTGAEPAPPAALSSLKQKATALRIEAFEALGEIREHLNSVKRGLDDKARQLR